MSRFWSDTVRRLTPYVPGEQPKQVPGEQPKQVPGEQPKQQNIIKLNTNECPYGPSPRVLTAINAEIADSLRLYPDPNAERLTQAIATHFFTTEVADLNPDNVFVGNGSDEILAHTFNGLLSHPRPVLYPDISYSFYPVYCNLYNITAKPIPLADNFTIDVDDYRLANGGIIITNPNAPTGILLPLDQIETLLQHNPDSVVVVDEAYIDFGGTSAVSLIPRFENLLVIQTLSKSRSLAGLRVGFALGHQDLIDGLNRVKNSFNSYPLARMSISGAVAAIEDQAYFEDICRRVIETREWLSAQLNTLGFAVLPSAANFIFVSHPQLAAATIAAQLRQQNILVRYFDSPRIDNYLRISIGTDDQCRVLVTALRTVLNAAG